MDHEKEEGQDRFTVVISDSGVIHYLNGMPLTDEEVAEARLLFGEPEHDEMVGC